MYIIPQDKLFEHKPINPFDVSRDPVDFPELL